VIVLGCYVETPLLCIGNDKVELKLDRRTGFIRDIFCKETGIHHKDKEDSGIWPFGLRLGESNAPDLLRVEHSPYILPLRRKPTIFFLKLK
jgi:hypothetical protein